MITLDQIRAQYPGADRLSDDELIGVAAERYGTTPDIFKEAIGYQPAPVESPGIIGRAKDLGISALKGAIAVPEAAVGLADVVTGGYAGKAAEAIGFRPKEAKDILSEGYSDAQKRANEEVQKAEGIWDTLKAAVSNPSVLAQTVTESVPSMLGGGIIAGGLIKGTRLGATAAGRVAASGIGEGVVGAGSSAEQIRQQTDDGLLTGKQAAVAGASGVATGALGMLGAKVAKSLGIADVDSMLAGAAQDTVVAKGVARRILEGAVAEGLIEELPQSVQEQVAQNYALGKPLDDGVSQAAVLGTLSGAVMGAGANLLPNKPAIQPPKPPQPPEDKPAAAAPPLMLGNTPDPIIVFPDGTAGRRADLEAYINGPPEDQQVAARAKLMGMGARDATPEDILKAPDADSAIAAFTASLTGTDMGAMLGQDNPLVTASREMQAQTAADEAQQGLPALNPSTNGEPADAQAAQAVQSPPQRQEPTARAAPVPAPVPDPVQPAEGSTVPAQAQTDPRLIPVSKRAPAQPTEGPGSDAGNGFKQGPKQGERYRVGVVAAAGGAVSLEKRLPAGTAATFYVGKDGNLIDGDSVNFIGTGRDKLWIPATPEQAQQAQAILDEMGRLALNDPARQAAKARLKALVLQGNTNAGAPNAADVARPGGQRADDRSGSDGVAGVPDQRPSDVLASPAATEGQEAAGQEPTAGPAPVPAVNPDPVQPAEGGAVPAKAQDPRLIPVSKRGEPAVDAALPEDPRLIPVSKRKSAGASNLRKAGYARNPLLTFLAKHGLFHDKDKPGSQKSEFSPDRQVMVMGYGPVFRKNGRQLDELLPLAIQDGYLPPGSNEADLANLIASAIRGNRVAPMFTDDGAEKAAALRDQRDREDYERKQAEVFADLDRQASEELEGALADLTDAEFSTLRAELLDGPVADIDAESNTDIRSAMKALGFTDQEIDDATAQGQGAPGQDGAGRSGPAEAAGQGQGEGAQQGVDATAEGSQDDEGLTDDEANTRAGELIDRHRAEFAKTPSGMTADQFHDYQDRRRDADKAVAAEILKLAGNGDGLLLPWKSGTSLIALHKDPRTEGAWRTTTFLPDMTPAGHMEFNTPMEAAAFFRDSAKGKEPAGLTAPTRADVLRQQDRAENAQALDDKAQIDREAEGFQLQAQTVDTRTDTTGDMFGGPSVDDYQQDMARRRKPGTEPQGPSLFDQPAEPEPAAPATNRFEAGQALTKEQRKAVLASLVDVYKAKGAPREQKGIGADGNERYGYVHSPELFEKSDITGAMVRYYVTLPDGRIAHPSELFPDYTQADIDAAMAKNAADERNDADSQRRVEANAEQFSKPSAAEADADWLRRNPGPNALVDWRTNKRYSLVPMTKDGKFYSVRNDDVALMGRLERGGWKRAEAAPAEAATTILDAAGVTGKDRLEALKDVKAGTVTPEELAAAYPPSAAQGTTDAQRQQAADHAKELGGRVVWQRGDLALIEGYSLLSGDSVYIAANGGQRTRVDIKSYTGKGYTETQKAELMKARADAVRAADELLARNPDGPFADAALVFADDIPASVQGVVRGWIGLLGLDGARIVVTTPASGAAMADGMAGKFRRIGKASLSGDNTNGTMQPLGGDDFHIAVRPGVSTLKALEVMAHELGHIVERRAFAQASAGTQQAIRDAHAAWLKENGNGRALDMAQAMRAYRSGQTTGFSEDAKAMEAGAYWRSFGEWFADQVSRWATTEARPVGVVEQFFKRLADRLRMFFTGERTKFKPNATVAQWLDSLAKDVPPAEEDGKFYSVRDDDTALMKRLERAGWVRADAAGNQAEPAAQATAILDAANVTDSDPQDRNGLRAEDRRLRAIDAAAEELAGQLANDMLDGQYATPSDRADIAKGLKLVADDAKVPVDDLREAVLKRIKADERLSKRQTKQIVDALNPTKTPPAEAKAELPGAQKPTEVTPPAWHTAIPDQGTKVVPADEKNYSQIPHRVATEAVEAVTQTQSMGNMALYAYVLPATDGHHGAARLFPDDQTPPAPWSLLFPEAMRMGMLTKEQAAEKLASALRRAPILGTMATAQPEKPRTAEDHAGNVAIREPDAPYETDLFGQPVPTPAGRPAPARPKITRIRGDVQPASGVQDTPAPAGEYFASTIVGSEVSRELGASKITTPEHAAQATAYLYKSAVERLDGIVTDANGKPLGIVGGFKGALAQTSVYPATLVAEAVRIPGAARIWFSHNHPSGNPQLSPADENLNQVLTDVFRGSGIEPMGLLAIGDGRFSHVGNSSGGMISNEQIPAPTSRVSVPVIERTLAPNGITGTTISSPQAAKQVARDFYDRAKQPGLMLLNSQNGVIGWVPITDQMKGELRGTGGLNAIYRAISESNAGAAIIVHGGELTHQSIPKRFPRVTPSENIAAALSRIDVRPLDSIEIRPTSTKSAAEIGMSIADGPVFARGNPFYSALTAELSKVNAAAQPALGWANTINGLVKAGKVKQDEVDWSGVLDFLRLQTGKVPKASVVQFLDANGVKVEETVLGGDNQPPGYDADIELLSDNGLTLERNPEDPGMVAFMDENGDLLRADELAEEPGLAKELVLAAYRVQEAAEAGKVPTKYGTYQLPGGTKYREVLLTLPTQAYRYKGKLRDLSALTSAERVRFKDMSGFAEDGNFRDAAELDEWQALFKKTKDAPEGFKSGHWDQPNILAHIRVNDRTDADGRRVLFIEEIQSDWGQQGKKQGFKPGAAGQRRFQELGAEWDSLARIALGPSLTEDAIKAREQARQRQAQISDEMNAISDAERDGLPGGPFVTKTDAWLSLALKRIVKMAVDEGYDRVAFINGEQSAERYSLDKLMNSITAYKRKNGNFNLTGYTTGNAKVDIAWDIPAEKVEDYVGKELAKRIVDESGEADSSKTYSGDGLKVGGEGMRAFYNKIVPNTLKDVLRKVGGGVLETVDLGRADRARRHDLIRERRELAMDDPRRAELDGEIDRLGRMESGAMKPMQQPGFTITPAMREKAADGLPMFDRNADLAQLQALLRAVGPADSQSANAVRNMVAPLSDKWNIPVTVVQRPNQLPVPAPSDARGLYHNGQIYLVASNINSRAAVMRTLGHEAIAHHGLREMLGDDGFSAMMRQINLAVKAGNPAMRKISEYVRRTYVDENGKFELTPEQEADEIAARAVEDGIDPESGEFRPGFGWLKGVFARVVQFLRDLGITVPMSNTELQGVLVNSMRGLEAGAKLQGQNSVMAAARKGNQTDSPEFQEWFGDSKVVDADGKPLVVYHGTGQAMSGGAFDRNLAMSEGGGFYFSHSPLMKNPATNANDYAANRSGDSANVMPVYLRMSNPLVVGFTEPMPEGDKAIGAWLERMQKFNRSIDMTKERYYRNAIREAKAGSHDGVIVRNVEDVANDAGRRFVDEADVYIAFDPTQIKSAIGNAGAFDPKNPDIRFARANQPSDIDRAWRDLSGMNKLTDYDSTPETKVTGTMDEFVLSREKGKQWAALNVREFRKDDGEVVYSSSLEVGSEEFPRGTGAATTMYLQALNIAKQRGMGWMSEGVRSDAAQAIYRRLTEAGVPFKEVDGSSYVDAASLKSVDLAAVARKLAGDRPMPAFARSAVTGKTITPTWQAPDPTRMDDLLYSMQDKHIDTKRVVTAVRDAIGGIADNLDPYLQEELYHGRAAMATKEFLEKSIRPLLTDMQARGVEMSDFEEYLHNRHAERRNEQVAKVNPNMPDGGSGIKTADARAYLSGLSPAKRTAYQALAKRVDQMNRDTRALLVSSGLEKQSTIDAWQAAYGDEYVPLMREEMDNGAMGIGQGFSVRGSSSKRAMGSNKPVANILANIALQREKAITRAEKRRIGEALYGMVLSAPNPDFWFAVDPALEQSPAQITATSMQLISMGLNPIDAEAIAREPRQRYIDPRTGQVAERINPVLRSADNVLAVRIDGEDKYVFFNAQDPRAMRMAKSLKNLDSDQLGVVMGNVAKMTRYFASINTQFNPVFGVVNLTRDIQTALLNLQSTRLAGKQADVMKHVGSALRGIYIDLRDHRAGKQPTSTWAGLFEEFQREGGATGYRDMYANAQERADAITDELKKIKHGKALEIGRGIFGWLSDYNESMENAVRLATYKVAKEQGMSNQQAASLAKNLTVNFNRKGQVALQAGALYAFFNAAVQGSTRMAQTMFESGKVGKLSGLGKKIMTGGLLLGSMQALLLAAAGYDDEEPPDFVRERSLVLPIGGDKYVSIPMPLGFHVIPNLARIPTEWAMGGFRDTPKRLAQLVGLFADAFNPIGSAGMSLQTLAPTIIDPLAALAENRDWTGKPIAKKDFNSMQPTAGHTRAKDTATPWARAIAYGVNWVTGGTDYKPGMASPTPDQIDYLIGQATGGVGREVSKLSQVAGSTMSGEELPLYKIPLLGRFVGTTAGQAAESGRFYENLKQIGEHDAELSGLKKDRRMAEYQEYLRDNPQARLVPIADRTYREVSKLIRMKRDAIKAGASSERVKMLDQQITSRMRQFNERIARMQEPVT